MKRDFSMIVHYVSDKDHSGTSVKPAWSMTNMTAGPTRIPKTATLIWWFMLCFFIWFTLQVVFVVVVLYLVGDVDQIEAAVMNIGVPVDENSDYVHRA